MEALHLQHIDRMPWQAQENARAAFYAALTDPVSDGLSPEQRELREALGVA